MRSSLACWTTEELSAQLEGDLTGALAALRTLTQLERMAPSPALQATLRRFLAHDDERVRWIVLFLIVSVLNVRGRELLAGAKDHAATPAHRKVARSALEQFDAAAGRGGTAATPARPKQQKAKRGTPKAAKATPAKKRPATTTKKPKKGTRAKAPPRDKRR